MAERVVLNIGPDWYTVAVAREREDAYVARIWLGVPAVLGRNAPGIHAVEDTTRVGAVATALGWCYARSVFGPGYVQ